LGNHAMVLVTRSRYTPRLYAKARFAAVARPMSS